MSMWKVTGTRAHKSVTVIIEAADHNAAVMKASKVRGLLLAVDSCVLIETLYAESLEAARCASRSFAEAQRKYRAREIGDAEFLAARAKYDESSAALDAARGEVAS